MELKPCQCGGGAIGPEKIGGSNEKNGYNFRMVISCECGLTISKNSHHDKLGWCNDNGQALTAVVKAWNSRPTEDQLVEEIQERVAMLDAAHEIRKGQTETNAALRKRVEELEELVASAYREGFREGKNRRYSPRVPIEFWMASESCRALFPPTKKEGE